MISNSNSKPMDRIMYEIRKLVFPVCALFFLLLMMLFDLVPDFSNAGVAQVKTGRKDNVVAVTPEYWVAPDIASITDAKQRELALLGRDIISRTSFYFGPKGIIAANATNGMNCQNCHLQAGTKTFGINYSLVASTYPKYRARSGSVEDIYKRVNDCFERSLNGKAVGKDSREMQAIVTYINFIGSNISKGENPNGSGFHDLAFLDRECNPVDGEKIFQNKCASCHGKDGSGKINAEGWGFTYPPLWGDYSYNTGAGLYRVSYFAKFIKYNMPEGVTHTTTQLTDGEAWDIAAFVNSMPRPVKDVSGDWPKKEEKPFDYPFGPYVDGFSEKQHKFGPYKPIVDKNAQMKKGINKTKNEKKS